MVIRQKFERFGVQSLQPGRSGTCFSCPTFQYFNVATIFGFAASGLLLNTVMSGNDKAVARPTPLTSPLARMHPGQLKGGTPHGHQAEIRAFWRPAR
ncbi:hypothetical protein GO003_010300 [Methylicorpusculum oleiharenae]|uniref:hypothetical protein n=1 Tax=Methylicorpusculum oleiharenae TaxID=1338687 RepID=UPI001359462A|nr:hypothetical protein [Methylicorpusculum oleiharenae]MCD2450784.1 hypothetical protein [Methylicorpusculum oleiharenae]